jgi:hypothetical protein
MKTTTTHDAHGEPAHPRNGEEHPLMFAARGINRFFFEPLDPTSLGLMRIAAGILILYVHLVYCIGLSNYLGPYAWVANKAWTDKPGESGVTDFIRHGNPMQAPSSNWKDGWLESDGELIKGQPMWSLFYHVEDMRWIWPIHLGVLVIMLLFTLGLWTRVTSALTWICSLMYIQRLQGMLFGLDTMTNLGLLYLMIAPCGAAFSLDRWLAVRRERQRLGDKYVPQPPQPLVSARFATRLIQINYCIIYLAAGTSKLLGSSWWNGTAPNRFLLNYSFAPFDVPLYVTSIKWLASHRFLWELNGAIGVIGTLFIELGFSFLVWNRRMRWFMVSSSIIFHTLIALLMGLVTFSLMMLVLVLAFVPPEAVRQFVLSVTEQVKQLFLGRVRRREEGLTPALSR